MSFLDSLKARRAAMAENNAENSEQAAPAAKKLSPLEAIRRRREAAAKAKEETAAETKEETSLQERMESAMAKAMEEPIKAKEDKLATDETESEKTPQAEDAAKEEKQEEEKPQTQEKDESAEEKKQNEDAVPEEKEKKATDDKAETEEAPKAETKTEASAETEEVAPKKTRRGRKKAAETPAPVQEECNNYDILGKKAPYDEMAGIVMDYYLDDDWKKLQDELSKELENIRIEDDMNPGTLKAALADLNNLNDKIFRIYVEQKQLLSILTDKESGIITRYLADNSVGNNAEERKRNALRSLTEVEFDGKKVNLTNLVNVVKMRLIFVDKLSSDIDKKSKLCITMASAIKVEEKLCVA